MNRSTKESATVEEIAAAHRRGNELQAELAEKYPAAGLTFGYIGNCSMSPGGYDHRSWMFFTKLPSAPSWGKYHPNSTDDLPTLIARAGLELEAWLQKQLAR